MSVIIAGGAGLIGRALAWELVDSGYEVIVLSRNPQKIQGLPHAVQVMGWDAQSSAGWGHLADGAEAIVNLAGESIAGDNFLALILKRWTPERKRLILQSRVLAGNAIVQAIHDAKQKPKVVIQSSAVGYYGSRGNEELTENSPPSSDSIGKICVQWESATAAVETIGVRRAIIRTAGVVMSLEGGAFPFMLLPFRLYMGGPLASGKQWFSWIHYKDQVRAIRFLIEHPSASGAFNLSAPQALTNFELSKALGRVMRRPSFVPVPGFALRILFGEKADLLLGSQRQVPQHLLAMVFKFRFPEIEAALRDLLKK